MRKGDGNGPKVDKSGRGTLVKIDGLWVHRGSVRPDVDWERVVEDVRDERIASVLIGSVSEA